SPAVVFPSSQVSPAVMMLFPQAVVVQLMSQPSPFMELPSSHSSDAWVSPSPQDSKRQEALQPSSSLALPSSHCSTPALLMIPSPQVSNRQFSLQPSPPMVFPSSQSSPRSGVPLPQALIPFTLATAVLLEEVKSGGEALSTLATLSLWPRSVTVPVIVKDSLAPKARVSKVQVLLMEPEAEPVLLVHVKAPPVTAVTW